MSNISDPGYDGRLVTPDDDGDLPGGVCDFLYVWVAGNLAFLTQKGTPIGPYAVVAGQVIPYRVSRVLTSTTAVVTTGTH